MSDDIYLGLPPEKAYLEHGIKLWKTTSLMMLTYVNESNISQEAVKAVNNSMGALETIAQEHEEINKIEDTKVAKTHLNTYLTILQESNGYSEDEYKRLDAEMKPVYQAIFPDAYK